MRISFFLLPCLLVLAGLTGCQDDNQSFLSASLPVTQPYGAYLLAEGSMGQNNSSLIACSSDSLVSDFYLRANCRILGDTGNDLLWSDGCLYVAVSRSRYIAKLDANGKELARHDFSDEEGDPRFLEMYAGHLYVSLYGGMIQQFDTATLSLQGSCPVGSYPEEMTIVDSLLLVCNSGWGYDQTLSVINLHSFSVVRTVEVAVNPTRIVSDGHRRAYFLTTSYDASWTPVSRITELDTHTWQLRDIAAANRMLWHDSQLFLIATRIDYGTIPYTYSNRFFCYDTETGLTDSCCFIPSESAAARLASCGINMFDIDPVTGMMFFATTEQDDTGQLTASRLFCISADGSQVWEVDDAGGVNISTIVFSHS